MFLEAIERRPLSRRGGISMRRMRFEVPAMPSEMTISKVGATRTFKTQHGEYVSYKIKAEGHGEAELVQKPTTHPPTVGQNVFGELVPGREGFPPKLKKHQQQAYGATSSAPPYASGSVNAPRDDATGLSIERQVAYKSEIELVVAGKAEVKDIRKLTDAGASAIRGE